MADIDITQVEADDLIAMEKHRVDDKRFFRARSKACNSLDLA
jgi:hypothetical protein